MTMVLWSVDSEDYLRPGVDAIVDRVLANVSRARSSSCTTRAATAARRSRRSRGSSSALRRRHYTLVSVPQLLEDAPPPLAQPKLGVGAG